MRKNLFMNRQMANYTFKISIAIPVLYNLWYEIMLEIFYFQNCIMILWITDRRWNEIWLTVAFHYLDQWSSWNSCSVNPYVIFWKMARNEIIREIDFFHLKCCLSLEGSTFYDGNLYHRSKLYIELLFYLLIKKFAQ